MKALPVGILLAAGMLCFPAQSPAQLIEKQIVQPNGAGSTAGIVFQGSRNMRDLGKRRSTTSTVIVPSLNAVTVIPALQNEELQPKPRFGYGAESSSATSSEPSTTQIVSTPQIQVSDAPVYQFRYSYPVNRDYWVTRPYRPYFYSPFGSYYGYRGWNFSGYRGYGGFRGYGSWNLGRFSLSFGW
ncbi:MAG: hypothetical protein AAGF67_02805 [Verrucomicrobiota bacterium]